MKTIDQFTEQHDDSTSIANFLFHNQFLFDPYGGTSSEIVLKAWKILMDLLLEVDNKSNKIAIEIILNLHNSTQHDSNCLIIKLKHEKNFYSLLEINNKKYEPLTMLQISLNLFVKLFYDQQPIECFKFLIEQFQLTSEYNSNGIIGEEDVR